MHRDVGDVGAELDQRDPELAFLVAQASECRSDRRSDDGFDPEMRGADDGVDVPERGRVGGDHVDIDPEPVGEQTDRLLDPLRTIDRVQRGVRVKHDLAVAVDRLAPAP